MSYEPWAMSKGRKDFIIFIINPASHNPDFYTHR